MKKQSPARSDATSSAPMDRDELQRQYHEVTGKCSPFSAMYSTACRAAEELRRAGAAVPETLQNLIADLEKKLPTSGSALGELQRFSMELAATTAPAVPSFAFRLKGTLSEADQQLLDQHAAALAKEQAKRGSATQAPARKLADAVRERFDLGHVPDLEYLCRCLNLRIEKVDTTSFVGALVRVGEDQGGRMLLQRDLAPEGRRRFTIAHEIGHFLIEGEGHAQTTAGRPASEDDEAETPANEFAVELLLPEKRFLKLIDFEKPSLKNIDNIANYFHMSATATALRYQRLCAFRCAILKSQGDKIEWCVPLHGNGNFPYLLRSDTAVPVGSVLEKRRADERLKSGLHEVPSVTWLAPDDAKRVPHLFEDSKFYPRHDVGLTLLWVPK